MRVNAKERRRVGRKQVPFINRSILFTDMSRFFRTACSFCRESKKKCSGTAPCTQCLRRGLPHECLITYLPRGFRSRNKHASTGGSRQTVYPVSQASATSAQDALVATLPSPSNVMGSLPGHNTTAAAGPIGPLSPSESRDDNEDNRSYRAAGSIATAALGGYTAAEDTSLTAPGPRMLLSSHGERGMLAWSLSFSTTIDIGSLYSLCWSCCLDSVSSNREAGRCWTNRTIKLFAQH